MASFTHFDRQGNARMVDVSQKDITERKATACASVAMDKATLELIMEGRVKKGDVLQIARLAGIMAAKQTSNLIPLCHPLGLDLVEVDLQCDTSLNMINISATCGVMSRTGVEMEALTAASVAAMTVYDMCKSVDRAMGIFMIPVAEAIQRITKSLSPIGNEVIQLSDACGRVLAKDVSARISQPPFDVSSMDGYAVRQEDIDSIPHKLKIIGSVPAGSNFDGEVKKNQTVQVFTGSRIPRGADTVVIQENVNVTLDDAVVLTSSKKGQFIRNAGLDFKREQVGLTAGQILSPRAIGYAASMNHPWLSVRRKPTIGILSTGNEIVMPGEPLGDNQVVSSNSHALMASIESFGGKPFCIGIAPDQTDKLQSMVNHTEGADILVTTGGASVGKYDLVQSALKEIGLDLDFWQIAMRPGKPLIYGRLGSTHFLGLPGNPVSALVCALIFLRPAILALLGAHKCDLPIIEVPIMASLEKNDERQDYLRAKFQKDGNGKLAVSPYDYQDSSMISVFANADALIVRPPFDKKIEVGATVRVIPLAHCI